MRITNLFARLLRASAKHWKDLLGQERAQRFVVATATATTVTATVSTTSITGVAALRQQAPAHGGRGQVGGFEARA